MLCSIKVNSNTLLIMIKTTTIKSLTLDVSTFFGNQKLIWRIKFMNVVYA